MRILLILTALLTTSLTSTSKTIHLFVALCDNKTQGIAKVGVKIGDGDKPSDNLYWGCSDGSRSYFSKSKNWERLSIENPKNSPILERIIFRHKTTKTILVADAYQGSKIKVCTKNYLKSLQGDFEVEIKHPTQDQNIKAGSYADLVAYIGHNGLMDFELPHSEQIKTPPKIDTITLCCISKSYFPKYFTKNTTPLLQTKSLMYPGAFILHDAIEGWLKNETKTQIYNRAAKAYAKNQKISTKAAKTIFIKP